jgi:hypothetical protein
MRWQEICHEKEVKRGEAMNLPFDNGGTLAPRPRTEVPSHPGHVMSMPKASTSLFAIMQNFAG